MNQMLINDVEQALAIIERMIRARAAMHVVLGDKYSTIIRGWKSAIREKMTYHEVDAYAAGCDILEGQYDQRIQLEVLAATLEIIEEDVPK